MDSYADVGCLLKVNVHCDACKMKMMEVLSSVCGVYSVTIDAEEGTAKVSGEVDPNILLRALARSGRHAEIVWVKLNHPQLMSRSSYYDNYYGYNYNRGGAASSDNPFYRRGLQYYPNHQQYYPMRTLHPCYGNNYSYASAPPPRQRNYYQGY